MKKQTISLIFLCFILFNELSDATTLSNQTHMKSKSKMRMTSHAEAAKFALTPGEKNVLTYSFEMMIKDEFLSRKTEQAQEHQNKFLGNVEVGIASIEAHVSKIYVDFIDLQAIAINPITKEEKVLYSFDRNDIKKNKRIFYVADVDIVSGEVLQYDIQESEEKNLVIPKLCVDLIKSLFPDEREMIQKKVPGMVLLSEDPVEKDSLGTHKMNTESIDRGESMKIKKTASTEDYSQIKNFNKDHPPKIDIKTSDTINKESGIVEKAKQQIELQMTEGKKQKPQEDLLPELKFNFKSVVKLSKNEINAEKIEKALKYYKDNKFITFDLKKLNPKEKPLPHYEKPEGSTNINDGKNPTIPPPAPAIVNGKQEAPSAIAPPVLPPTTTQPIEGQTGTAGKLLQLPKGKKSGNKQKNSEGRKKKKSAEEEEREEIGGKDAKGEPEFAVKYAFFDREAWNIRAEISAEFRNFKDTSELEAGIYVNDFQIVELIDYEFNNCGELVKDFSYGKSFTVFDAKIPIPVISFINISLKITAWFQVGVTFGIEGSDQYRGCGIVVKPYLQAGAALIAGLDIWVADIGVYAKGTIINTELKFGAMVGYDPAGHQLTKTVQTRKWIRNRWITMNSQVAVGKKQNFFLNLIITFKFIGFEFEIGLTYETWFTSRKYHPFWKDSFLPSVERTFLDQKYWIK